MGQGCLGGGRLVDQSDLGGGRGVGQGVLVRARGRSLQELFW